MSTWTNWGGTVSTSVAAVHTPGSTEEVADLLATAHGQARRVRPVGSGHSFSGIAAPSRDHLSADRLTGVLAVDLDRGRVRVGAGTPLHVLNPTLWGLGLALPNLGDIDRQTIAGAVATGTHGTGTRLQGIASAVCGLTLVTGAGEVVRVGESENADLLPAVRVGLGALGVVTEVELQLVPAFRLLADERPEDLDALLEHLHETADANRHLDAYWFPHTNRAFTKRNNVVDDLHPAGPLPAWREALDDRLLANVVFEGVCRVMARRPAVVPRVNGLTSRALSARRFADRSYRVFCSPRDVRFVESEYAVPREAVVPVLTELRRWVEGHDARVAFPVEVRFTGADDSWLSTAYERENAYVAVHQYHRMDHRAYFAAFEAIVAEHAGRPHWGKVHTLGAGDLRRLYPRFDDFVALRDRFDPGRVLANDYLDRVLGA